MKTLDNLIALDLMLSGSCWELIKDLNGFADHQGTILSTQVSKGRNFQIMMLASNNLDSRNLNRVKVRLLEDGYICWLSISELLGNAFKSNSFQPRLITEVEIQKRISAVLKWVEDASTKANKYLWGGTLGPDFDCSGLVQAAFASQKIWLPRDAYQQERFCNPIEVEPCKLENLLPGDLIFFGNDQKCTHVALHLNDGFFWHSSGLLNGHNGIGIDCLHPNDKNPVACYYRSILRGAGRVHRCHDGTTLP